MQIKIGYDLTFRHYNPTPLILMLEVHPSRVGGLHELDVPRTNPVVTLDRYYDDFGNRCSRLVAPPGDIQVYAETTINDSGLPDEVAPGAQQVDVQNLPYEALRFLRGSRYCDTQILSNEAWLMWSPEFGQEVKLGLLLRGTDLHDGQTETVFGGVQGESGS